MAGRYQKRNNGMAAVRNAGIVCVLGLVSFVIGFFLLARLLPAGNVASSTPPPVEGGTTTPAANTPVATVTTTPTTVASPKGEVAPPPREAKKDADSGPLLLSDDQNAKSPSEEVRPIQQTQPDLKTDPKTEPATERLSKPEENNGDKKTTEPDPRPDTSTRSRAETGAEGTKKSEVDTEPKKKESVSKRRQHKKSRSVLQPATEPDAPATAPKTTDPTETILPERTTRSVRRTHTTAPPTKGDEQSPPAETNAKANVRRLYRVQVNVYSTEDAAKKEVDNLLDKHVTAHVRKIIREGKTLYSVQQGAYRTKEKAQAAKDKLREQGVEAYITGR